MYNWQWISSTWTTGNSHFIPTPSISYQKWGTPDVNIQASIGLQVQQVITVCGPNQTSSTGIVCPGNFLESIQVNICLPSRSDSSLIASQNRGIIYYTDILKLLGDSLWYFTNSPNLLSQNPLFHPASQSLALTAWMF